MTVSFEEKRLIELYRLCSPDQKEAIMICASTLAKNNRNQVKDHSSNIIEFTGRKGKQNDC